MKTKCVYVLVSNEQDYYYEQLLCSVYSLKLYNPSAFVCLVVDKQTEISLVNNRSTVFEFISEHISIDVPKEFTQMQRSRYLKTNLRQFVDGDFLFIDTDTIIRSNIDEVDRFDYEIAAVPDAHVNIGSHRMKNKIYEWARIGGWKVNDDMPYFNSGIIFVKDTKTTHLFYERWYHFWYANYQKGLYKDQSSLAKTNEEMGYIMEEMNGEWNCQIIENGLRYMTNSKILHYYATRNKGPHLFNRIDTFYELKSSGVISNNLKSMIKNCTSSFVKECKIVSATDEELLRQLLHKELLNNRNILSRLVLKLIDYAI